MLSGSPGRVSEIGTTSSSRSCGDARQLLQRRSRVRGRSRASVHGRGRQTVSPSPRTARPKRQTPHHPACRRRAGPRRHRSRRRCGPVRTACFPTWSGPRPADHARGVRIKGTPNRLGRTPGGCAARADRHVLQHRAVGAVRRPLLRLGPHQPAQPGCCDPPVTNRAVDPSGDRRRDHHADHAPGRVYPVRTRLRPGNTFCSTLPTRR